MYSNEDKHHLSSDLSRPRKHEDELENKVDSFVLYPLFNIEAQEYKLKYSTQLKTHEEVDP